MTASSRPMLPALHGLRFFAALFVLLSHVIMSLPAQPSLFVNTITNLSGLGMTLFFVLSGFVIHYGYYASLNENWKKGTLRFIWARISRLYPLFISVMILEIILRAAVHAYKGTDFGERSLINPEALPFYLTMTQTWIFKVIGDHNLIYQFGPSSAVAWSISTEFFLYLLYAGGLFFALKSICFPAKHFLIGGLAFLALCVFYLAIYLQYDAVLAFGVTTFGPVAGESVSYQDSFVRWLIYFCPYVRIPEFLCGALAANLFMNAGGSAAAAPRHTFYTLALVAFIFSVHQWLYSYHGYVGHIASPLYGPPVAILIYCLARYPTPVGRFLSHPVPFLLGEASYSIYLLHPLIVATNKLFIFDHLSKDNYLAMVLGGLFVIAQCLAVSIACYRWYEKPWQNRLRRMTKNTFKPAT